MNLNHFGVIYLIYTIYFTKCIIDRVGSRTICNNNNSNNNNGVVRVKNTEMTLVIFYTRTRYKMSYLVRKLLFFPLYRGSLFLDFYY